MFQRDIDTIEPDDLENAPNGLCYVPNFLYHQECEYLKSIIDQQIWRTDLKRRTQHYGARYDYASKNLKFDVTKIEESCLAPLVSYINPLFQQLSSSLISQIIVNEYLTGEKISPHTDASCFGPVIMSITLGTSAVFRMTRNDESFDLKPGEGDLVILTGEARYKWKHETLPFKKDGRRISITFRSIL